MTAANLIEYASSNNSKPIKISKGELVYLEDNHASSTFISALLGLGGAANNDAQFAGAYISHMDKNTLIALRKKVAFISRDIVINGNYTVQETLVLYAESINIKINDSDLKALLVEKDLNANSLITELSELEKFSLKVLIGLIKKPDTVILQNPLSQLSEKSYRYMMDNFYQRILDEGLTCIITLSNLKLSELYPGRVISLS